MKISKIRIMNYRLLIDTELDVDSQTTLIVGRNNTAKTSCIDCISTVLRGKDFTYDDYPLSMRKELQSLIATFMKKEIDFSEFCEQLPIISLEFLVDYSCDDSEDNLGALSPFIIDVDIDTTEALIYAEYKVKVDEKTLWKLLETSFYKDNVYSPNDEEISNVIVTNFSKIFGMTIYAVNPKNKKRPSGKIIQGIGRTFSILFDSS